MLLNIYLYLYRSKTNTKLIAIKTLLSWDVASNTERQIQANLHVSVQFFQQRWVPLQSGEGFTQTGGQSQDPGSGRPLWLHVLPQFLTVVNTQNTFTCFTTNTQVFSFEQSYKHSTTAPVLCEYADSRRVVGAVGHIDDLYLGHQTQEEAPDPLLTLWESKHTNDIRLVNSWSVVQFVDEIWRCSWIEFSWFL